MISIRLFIFNDKERGKNYERREIRVESDATTIVATMVTLSGQETKTLIANTRFYYYLGACLEMSVKNGGWKKKVEWKRIANRKHAICSRWCLIVFTWTDFTRITTNWTRNALRCSVKSIWINVGRVWWICRHEVTSQTYKHGTYVDVNCRHFISELRRFLCYSWIMISYIYCGSTLNCGHFFFCCFLCYFCSFAWNIRPCQPRRMMSKCGWYQWRVTQYPSLARLSLERHLECGIYWKMAHFVDWCALFRFIAVNFYGRSQRKPMLPSVVRDDENCCVFRNMAGNNVRWTLWQWQTK